MTPCRMDLAAHAGLTTATVEAYNNEEFEIVTFEIVLQENQYSIAFQK